MTNKSYLFPTNIKQVSETLVELDLFLFSTSEDSEYISLDQFSWILEKDKWKMQGFKPLASEDIGILIEKTGNY